MLALGIRYLNGWVTASDVADRSQVEWPPHPGRVFMALAAAYFQSEPEPRERAALEWLEALDPPEVYAKGCELRKVVTQFVPVNPLFSDEKKQRAKEQKNKKSPPPPLQTAPGVIRTRQPRTFARAWLEDDTVWLVWPDAEPSAESQAALTALSDRVTRIGHSSSLVQVWVTTESPMTDASPLVPDESRAKQRLRVTTPGTLEDLEQRFNGRAVLEYGDLKVAELEAPDQKARAKVRNELREKFQNQPPVSLRPELSRWAGYAPPKSETSHDMPGTFYDPNLLIYRLTSASGSYRALELATTLRFTSLLRKALTEVASRNGRSLPESVIGHQPDGRPSESPHLALLPLGFVGSEHADGKLMGLGLALPRDISAADRRALLTALHEIRELKMGPLGVWRMEAPIEDRPPHNLLAETWTAPTDGALEWGTVTPVALDRHPKAKDPAAYREEMAKIIRRSCQRVTDEEPERIIVAPVSPHLGTPPAHAFPQLQRKDGSDLRHTHAIVVFKRAITGPLFLGAGRYRGYGFCRPIE